MGKAAGEATTQMRWLTFLLSVLFFAGLPIGLVRLGKAFVEAQEKSRLGKIHTERLEHNLFRLKREGGDLYHIQRELNSLYGLIRENDFSAETVGSSSSELARANLSFVTLHFFDNAGEFVEIPGRKIEMRSAMKRIYAALIEPEISGKSDLMSRNRSLFQSMLGTADPSDLVYQKGNVVSAQIKGRPGYFYWNSFYREASQENKTGGNQRHVFEAADEYRGGVIALFEEKDIPRDFALKQLIRRFNGDAEAGEGYALIDMERPAGSFGVTTLSRRVGGKPRQIFRRAMSLQNSYQRQDQDAESLATMISLDAARVVMGMKRFSYGLENHVSILINIVSLAILLLVSYWSWRLQISGDIVSVSIRHKLVALFLYATAIPVAALLLLGYQYMRDRNQVMVQERVSQLSDLTENIDDSFQAAVRSLERLYQRVSRLPIVRNGDMKRVKALSRRMNAAEQLSQLFLVDSKGRLQLMEDLPAQGRDLISKLIPTLARKIFAKRLGQSDENLGAKVSDVMVESITDSVAEFMAGKGSQKVFGDIIETNDRIIAFTLGNVGNLMYSNFIWGEGAKKPSNLLLIVHRTRDYARKYLERLVRQNQLRPEETNPVRLAVVSRVDDLRTYPADYTKYPFTREMAEKVISTETQHSSVENIGGQPYLVVASPLKKMPDFILITMYPRRLIDDVIRESSVKIGIIAVVSGCFAFFIGLLLSRHFLWPINELASGISAIDRRDFGYLVPPLGNDEFGDLGNTFNQVISNLQEMHVGKIVQEALFPNMPIRQGAYELHGASDSMSDLGGDYFDSFIVQDRYVVTIIGDVTGHGVPAALLMAMAKSSIAMLNPKEVLNGIDAMGRLNSMVCATVKKKLLMSMVYAVLDTHTHRIETVNAGHCFPLLYRASKNTATEIENPAFPLGARRNSVFQNVSIVMEPGDSLILYTDGIVEAQDSAGTAVGYPHLAQIVSETCSTGVSAADIRNEILNRVKRRIGFRPIEDDVTLIVIHRGNG